MINIILDDDLNNRLTPPNFVRFTTGEALITFLKENPALKINIITFDNDLGPHQLEGYQVLNKLLALGFKPQHINLHTQNIVQQNGMEKTIQSAIRHQILDDTTIITTQNLVNFTHSLKQNKDLT